MLHGLTIFLGAFLLFLVQPLLGKYLLPWFGGGPGVWTTCLLFFQAALLAGYAYAHLLASRLQLRTQVAVHGALLLLACAFLPILPDARWQPAPTDEPTGRILLLLAATVGVPYVALAATGPLVQRWLTHTRPGPMPYRLYALSNAGSLLALLAYPFVLEPLAARTTQVWLWSAGLAVFALLCGACARHAWRVSKQPLQAPVPALGQPGAPEALRAGTVGWWIGLPAVASLLLTAITQRLTSEVAPVPFLWVLPLAVYLLSFVLCFDHPRWYARRFIGGLLVVGSAAAMYLSAGSGVSLKAQIAVYGGVLFAGCMVCHGEVYRLRPASSPAQLTRFYLCLAAGGVAGSFFVGVIAPRFFHDTYELPIGVCAALGLAGVRWVRQRDARALGTMVCIAAAVAAVGFVEVHRRGRENVVATTRNFHGTLRLLDLAAGDPERRHWSLQHGATTHGAQFHAAEHAGIATTYYGPKSGVGVALQLETRPGRQVGVIGLGVGTLAAYGRAGDRFTFYEINPAVFAVAQSPFTYLKSSAARSEVVPGDARLALQAEAARKEWRSFDVLVLDAFSSDAIPVHLLTAEAMELYLAHLKPDGIIAVHISSDYLDLRGVLVGLSRRFAMDFVIVDHAPEAQEFWLNPSRWCLLTRDQTKLRQWLPASAEERQALEAQYRPVLWTDDHASLLRVLR